MKTFVKIISTHGGSLETAQIETFNSEREFLFYWQDPQNFGATSGVSLRYEILTPEQIEDFLLPLKVAVIAADRKKNEAKAILDEIKQANKNLFEFTGAGYFFQDDDGVVYKTNENTNGKFQYYEIIEINRTRREGETKGSLSMTDARDAGFVVEGK